MAAIGKTVPGYRLQSGDKINEMIDQLNNASGNTSPPKGALTASDALTATPSGNQSNALLFTSLINRVTVVGSANDSVKLPVSSPGLVVYVVNSDSTDSMQVFGSGTDTINDVATATGVAQAAGKSAIYFCPVAGKWYRVLSA